VAPKGARFKVMRRRTERVFNRASGRGLAHRAGAGGLVLLGLVVSTEVALLPGLLPQASPKVFFMRGTRSVSLVARQASKEITEAQIDDLAGLVAKAVPMPVPIGFKLVASKQAVMQVIEAVNDGKLPPEIKDQLLEAMDGGLMSDKLAENVANALNPYIDIPILDENVEKILIQKVVQTMIVEKGGVLEAAAGQSAKFASGSATFLQEHGTRTLVGIQTEESRKKWAIELNKKIDLPLLNEKQEQVIFEKAVGVLSNYLLEKIPPAVLKEAVKGGKDPEIEKFLEELLVSLLNFPMSDEDKHKVSKMMVDSWLGMATD